MKRVEEYMKLPYRMEITEDTEEGGYVVSCPDLPGCLTFGDTMEEALSGVEDAQRTWFSAALESGCAIREPLSAEKFSGQFKLRLPKSLHRSLAEHAAREGISMNQYCVYLLAQNDAIQSYQAGAR